MKKVIIIIISCSIRTYSYIINQFNLQTQEKISTPTKLQ